MHPNRSFRSNAADPGQDRAFYETLIDHIGFGMIFAETPDGPRVAHTPLLSTGDGAVQFHLARGNALTRYLTVSKAMIVINGPDAYISARWYQEPEQVPTWNYIALELEGPIREMDTDGLYGFLESISDRQEARIEGGLQWTMGKISDARMTGLMKGIVGFEMEISAWRDTVKLSQNKSPEERNRLIEGLTANNSPAIAELMHRLGAKDTGL